MNEAAAVMTTRTPRHLWVVGVIATLWSAMGAYDYVMTETKNEAYTSAFPPELMAWVYDLPAWVVACWAIAVWGGVLGGILLLARKRLAAPVFLASLLGMVATTVHTYVLSNGMEVMGDAFSLVFNAVIFVSTVGFYLYARAMAARGVLT
jgi:hypothetical protein